LSVSSKVDVVADMRFFPFTSFRVRMTFIHMSSRGALPEWEGRRGDLSKRQTRSLDRDCHALADSGSQ
ncbi:MAG TPA: hypothetical protein VF366_04745, partial [Dehalococcoidia bacterium]